MNILVDAQLIIKEAIDRAMPDNAVKAALGSVSLPHKVRLVARQGGLSNGQGGI